MPRAVASRDSTGCLTPPNGRESGAADEASTTTQLGGLHGRRYHDCCRWRALRAVLIMAALGGSVLTATGFDPIAIRN